MFTSRITLILALIVLTILCASSVMAHCHDSASCERPFKHLISRDRWEKEDDNTVDYYVNDDFSDDLPSFFPDVTTAASYWSRIEFDDEIVEFALRYKGPTHLHPNDEDTKNVIGWGWFEGEERGPLGQVFRYYDNTNGRRLIEQDMMLNYYHLYANHSADDDEKFCLLQVITHEFGHFIRLLDVPDNVCPEYSRYTMFRETGPGDHRKESLECEDKWGAFYTYNQMPWAAPSAIPIEHQLSLPEMTGDVTVTRLLQNYPDPFNPET